MASWSTFFLPATEAILLWWSWEDAYDWPCRRIRGEVTGMREKEGEKRKAFKAVPLCFLVLWKRSQDSWRTTSPFLDYLSLFMYAFICLCFISPLQAGKTGWKWQKTESQRNMKITPLFMSNNSFPVKASWFWHSRFTTHPFEQKYAHKVFNISIELWLFSCFFFFF